MLWKPLRARNSRTQASDASVVKFMLGNEDAMASKSEQVCCPLAFLVELLVGVGRGRVMTSTMVHGQRAGAVAWLADLRVSEVV